MDIISNSFEFFLNRETAVAIGKFDGVHQGHRRLLDEIIELKKRGLCACVFTFDPAPSVFFGGDPHVLNTNEEKHVIFERMGVDILVEFPMNSETAATPPDKFITEYLVNQMNMKFIAAGTDISFGDKGLGNAELLKQMSAEYGYEVKLIDKVHTSDGEEISSSLVRRYVEKGDMERVEELLGAAYSVSGKIVHGNQIGRTIGFPTINIYPDENKLLPPYGVYTSRTVINGKDYLSVSNVGCKPTIGGETRPSVETYIYDFDNDVYDKDAVVYLEKFKRPERRFNGLDELTAQLQKDIEESRR